MKTTTMLTGSFLLVVATMLIGAGTAQAAYVTIGDTGNSADSNGYGKVDYTYQISTQEASEDDFFQAGLGGTDGSKTAMGNIDVYDSMAYANYLTEQENGESSYNMYNVDTSANTASVNYTRQQALDTGKKIYALPTVDEWYKAAYYDSEKDSGAGGYWRYAIPDSELVSRNSDGTTVDAPPVDGVDVPSGEGWRYGYDEDGNRYFSKPNARDADLGDLENNGTLNMMGSQSEWLETIENDGKGRHIGGAYTNDYSALESGEAQPYTTYHSASSDNDGIIGVRMVAIPEPSSALLLGLGALAAAGFRRARRR